MYVFDVSIILNLWFLKYHLLCFDYTVYEIGHSGIDVALGSSSDWNIAPWNYIFKQKVYAYT